MIKPRFDMDRLKPAWMPVLEGLEIRKLFGIDTIQSLPFLLDFSTDRGELIDRDGQGTGFTRVQVNSNATSSYVASLIDLDTTAGVLRLTTTGNATNGGNSGSDNSLVNALETQFDGTTSGFTIQARLLGPLSYMNDPFEQGGIYFGPDQDNYVKLVAIRTSNGNFVQFRDEQSTDTGTTTTLPAGSQAQEVPIGSFASINTLDLRLVGDAASGRVAAFYSVNGGAFIKIPAELTLTGTKKLAFFNPASRAGILAFHKNNVGPITVTFDSFQITAGQSIANRPTITGTRPGHGATNVSRDSFVAADLNLPNIGGGVDASTLSTTTVRLFRTSDGMLIPGSVDTTGGGDAIVYQPSSPLEPNTNYTFQVTDQVKDTTGAAFVPFSMSFTTGTAGGQVDHSIAFEKIPLPTTYGAAWTGVTFGPDGKLYATTIDGRIVRFAVNSDGTLGAGQVINTIIDREGGPRMTLSIAFAPNSTASNLIAYVSHGQYAGLPGLALATNFTGKITKLTGANLQNAQDVVVGLPRSVKDHQNYQAVFGPNGRLYVNVSSMSAMGAPDNAWGQQSEVLMAAAILEIDVNAIGSGTIDVRTDVANPYNPFASNAPVKIYATGLRSAYDILFHSNGSMYSATNGSAAGGNTPAKPGVAGTALTNVATQNDYLFRVLPGKYYGHPNPTRGEYILGGGNPTSGADPGEIEPTPERPAAYPVGTQPEPHYGGFVYNFGKNYSPNGMIEYRGNAFNGQLNGKILIARYSGGDDILVLTPNSNGTIAQANAGYAGLTGFVDPLDLAQSPSTGFLYVAEYGAQRITLLRPITPGGGIADIPKRDYFFNDVVSTNATTTGNRAQVLIRNTGTGTLTISQAVFGGANASMFSLATGSTVPLTIAAGQSATLTVVFTATSTGIKTGTLTLTTNDPNRPQIVLNLRGIGTSGEGGSNEPSLQRILDLYFGTNTIRSGGSESVLDFPLNPNSPDEVLLPKLMKAGPGDVTIEILANFANSVSPSSRLGYYQPGNVGSLTRLMNIGQADAQSVNVTPQGVTSFDPGNAEFGLYGQFPAFTDRVVYSEDALNTWEGNANRRKKVRFYQLKNADGSIVPNAYVFTFEEWNVNYDQNDIVGIIRNVKAAPAGPEIGLENRQGLFMFPDRLVFNSINILDEDLPNAVLDVATLRINNTGNQPLNISNITINSTNWVIESGGGASTIAPGGFRDVVVRFVYKRTARGNELRSGILTIHSNDADEPTKQVELRGIAQSKSEDNVEPSAAMIASVFGFNIKVLNPGQSLNTRGEKVKVGEEVLSDFWARAESGLPVTVRMLAAFHQQAIDKNSVIRWFNQTANPPSTTSLIFKHYAADGQSLLPRLDSTGTNPGPAIATFNPGNNNFGFKVDGSWSVAAWNVPNSINEGGHAMRWYAAKDRNGKLIPNTYILFHDYT
ncbi:MAG: choice-of-anchor D domain-containing protein, partial [Phycisphaerae bacterium]|nr:choice-of-anchor D domain-containing protein [Phycisphaerae bacterium]MDW8261805.1 choice-of-anchor D domain-containing protein [Phycisphaerales bacterium]